MLKQFISGNLNLKSHFSIFKNLLLVCNLAALIIYCTMHLIFFDIPFDGIDELFTIIKMLLIASVFAAVISLLLLTADTADKLYQKRKPIQVPAYVKGISIAVFALIVFLSACNVSGAAETKKDSATTLSANTNAEPENIQDNFTAHGTKRDSATGLFCAYTNMEPDKIYLKMNNEVLNHTDIPIGESFLLVNDGIKGLVVKEGKVIVGCSLQITDSNSKILLNNKDLFAGKDSFEEKDARTLKCTVPINEQMQWEEKYNVTVIFWDKNGKGKIENKVTIRAIDMP